MKRLIAVLFVLFVPALCFSCAGSDTKQNALDTSQKDTAPTSDVPSNDANQSDTTTPPPTGSIAINEIVCQPEEGGTDWFEIVVIGDNPVDLSAVTVVDDNADHEPAPIGSITLEPGAFYVVKAISADDSSDDPSVPFKLGKDDSLTLFVDGEAQDTLDWDDGQAPTGSSFGRLPDGTGAAQQLKPTPGAPNEALSAPITECNDPFDPTKVVKVELDLSAEAWAAIKSDPQAEEFHEGAFIFDGTRVENVGIRTKGNSSLNSVSNMNTTRFPFKVDFNRYVDGQEFCGLKKLVFNNGFKDPSLMREHLAYKLAREVGLKSSRTMFVDLYVGEEHIGLYLMVEPVDDDFFLEEHFGNDGGDLYKPDWPAGDLSYRGDTLEDYPGVEIENNEETSDHSKLMALIDVANNGPSAQLESVLNVEMMLRYGAFNSLLVNLDSYTGNGHNYYIYEQEGVFTIIPWDMNEAFANFKCGCNRSALMSFFLDEPTCGPLDGRPLMNAALALPSSVEQYHAIVAEMLAGPFNVETMVPWIEETANLIRPYVQADPTKFYSDSQFEQSLTSDVSGGVIGLETFISERRAAIEAQLSGAEPSSNSGDGNCDGGGPGPGPGPGNNPKCPDGICDAFEQANPEVCPEDCE